jgi:hypothetical protein
MKIYFLATALIMTVLFFSYCNSSKKTASSTANVPPPKHASVYTGGVETLIIANCSPCHIPSKGGNKKALDSYDAVKANIDDIIKRISLNPSDRGFMPFRKAKLSDSTINAFKQWKDDGLVKE